MNENHNHEHCDCSHDHKADMSLNRYETVVENSNVTIDDGAVTAAVQQLLDEHYQENLTPEVYQFLLNCVDLTTLASDDSERSVADFVQHVNDFGDPRRRPTSRPRLPRRHWPSRMAPTRWTWYLTWAISATKPGKN